MARIKNRRRASSVTCRYLHDTNGYSIILGDEVIKVPKGTVPAPIYRKWPAPEYLNRNKDYVRVIQVRDIEHLPDMDKWEKYSLTDYSRDIRFFIKVPLSIKERVEYEAVKTTSGFLAYMLSKALRL